MQRLSTLLLRLGALVAALGAIGLVSGGWLNLPPIVVRRIAEALPFIVGGVLLVVGAAVGRLARRGAARRAADGAPDAPPTPAIDALPAAAPTMPADAPHPAPAPPVARRAAQSHPRDGR